MSFWGNNCKENSKWPGTAAHVSYERYKKSKAFGEARANGARKKDFLCDLEKGYLRFPKAKSMKASKALTKPGGKQEREVKSMKVTKAAMKAQVKRGPKVALFI